MTRLSFLFRDAHLRKHDAVAPDCLSVPAKARIQECRAEEVEGEVLMRDIARKATLVIGQQRLFPAQLRL
jgi:hypothetical protein